MIETGAEPVMWDTAAKECMRRAMACFATGVAVVTAAHEGELHGMTVNSLTSVSLEPPLLLVCLMTHARTTAAIRAAGRFNVSILDCAGAKVCRRFAEQGADHYSQVEHELDPNGVPVMAGSLVNLRCDVVAAHPHSDHLVVVGAVQSIRESEPAEPLVYFGGGFHRLCGDPKPSPEILRADEAVEWEWKASALAW
jgi:flavin reductase (DIM6/NTAB) family NADH-FMN oxidoreductase RutF